MPSDLLGRVLAHPLCINSMRRVHIASLGQPRIKQSAQSRIGTTHTLYGRISDRHTTLYMLSIDRTGPMLVRMGRLIVTGIGRPGGEVTRR